MDCSIGCTAAPVVEPARGTVSAPVLQRIGRLAAAQIEDGMTVLVLPGRTTEAVLPFLSSRELTVVTNGLAIAQTLAPFPGVTVVVLGGVLHADQKSLFGPMTEQNLAEFHVDVLVAGAYGVHPAMGVSGTKVDQAGYHRSMLRHVDALHVLADASKLGRQGPVQLAELSQVDALITDAEADHAVAAELRADGLRILHA